MLIKEDQASLSLLCYPFAYAVILRVPLYPAGAGPRQLNNTPMNEYDRFIYPFIILWTFGLFSPFVITNNADMNVYVNICFQLSWVYT